MVGVFCVWKVISKVGINDKESDMLVRAAFLFAC